MGISQYGLFAVNTIDKHNGRFILEWNYPRIKGTEYILRVWANMRRQFSFRFSNTISSLGIVCWFYAYSLRARTYPCDEIRAGPYWGLSTAWYPRRQPPMIQRAGEGRGGEGRGGEGEERGRGRGGGEKGNLPNTVIELETSMASSQTAAILKPTIRFVDVWRVLSGLRIPR